MTTMNKTKLFSELHTIIASRLRGAWLVKDDSQLSSALRALDLVLRGENQGAGGGAPRWPEKDPNEITPQPRQISLGEEINFELLSVFIGIRSLRDIPRILRKNGLINETEFDECKEWRSLGDPEMAAKSYVRKAYFQLLAQMSELNSRLP
jgi:hypothetical protein